MIEEIGIPIKENMVQNATVGPDKNAEYNTIYVTLNQCDTSFILVAYHVDEKRSKQYQITKTDSYKDILGAWGIYAASDGCIYCGTYGGAHLLRLDPKTEAFVDLGNAWPTEQYLYHFAEDGFGHLYASTYPGGGLIQYNLKTGEIKKIGPFDPLNQYCRSTVFYNDKIYCTLGTKRLKVVCYDPPSEEVRLFDYPGYQESADVVLLKRNNRLFGVDVHKKHICVFDGTQFLPVENDDARVMDLLNIETDIDFNTLSKSDVYAKSIGVMGKTTFRWHQPFYDMPAPLTKNRKFIGMTDREIYIQEKNGHIATHSFTYTSQGASMFMLDRGPQKKIYGSSILPLRLFRYDPATRSCQNLGNPSSVNAQIYSFVHDCNRMVFASYPGAMLSAYDVSKPWNKGYEKDSNPRIIGRIGQNQCRPYAAKMDEDGMIYIVSVADYGMQGGALTRFNPKTDALKVWENIAGLQSLTSIALIPHTNEIACGTSNAVGGGAPSIEHEICVLLFNKKTEQIAQELSPYREINADIAHIKPKEFVSLKCYENKLYGITNKGLFFIYDSIEKKYDEIVQFPIHNVITDGMDVYEGRQVYGVGDGKLFRYDLVHSKFEVLHDVKGWTRGFTMMNQRIYGFKGPVLISYRIS